MHRVTRDKRGPKRGSQGPARDHGVAQGPAQGGPGMEQYGLGCDHCTCSHGATHHLMVAWRGHRSVPHSVVVLSPLSAPLCPPCHVRSRCVPQGWVSTCVCESATCCGAVSPCLHRVTCPFSLRVGCWITQSQARGAEHRDNPVPGGWVPAPWGALSVPPISLCPPGAP